MSIESDFFEEVNRLLVVTPDPVIEYRLHYNEHGDIVMCSMQQHPESDNYIVTDKETYEMYFRYRVVKGKLELIKHDHGLMASLVKSTKGFKVVRNHAALLLESNETYNDTEYYDSRDN